MQTTVKSEVTFTGTGLHSAASVCVTVRPAAASTGVVFRRIDLPGQPELLARWDNVVISPLNTRLIDDDGVTVSTIEHLMAALAGCGIHNAIVEIDGPEVPILDGSAAQFVRGFVDAGVVTLPVALYAIEVLNPVHVADGSATAALLPAANLQIDFEIEFADAAIGRQTKVLNLANGTFVRELCDSRTFCRSADVAKMQANGLALGGSMDNAVVVDGERILTPGGLRRPDEAVRHKMLDALGDLSTAGAPLLARYVGYRAGHALTNKLLRALFADDQAWHWVKCDQQIASRLPGVGVNATDLEAVA